MHRKHHSKKHINQEYSQPSNDNFLKEEFNELNKENCQAENYSNPVEEKHTENILNEPTNKKCINEKAKISHNTCKVSVTSETVPLCENTNKPLPPIVTKGPVIIKAPVILAEPRITISISSYITLEDTILELKRIKKNVYVEQCNLIPTSEDNNTDIGILFISGFIRKNIEYATKEFINKIGSSGRIKYSTVKVNFNCATKITFISKPIFTNTTPQNEVEILENSIEICNCSENKIVGANLCQQSFRLTEFFNEKVFCELVSAEIIETDIIENPLNQKSENYTTPENTNFHDVTEKVVLYLTIKLLQNQQIRIL